MESCEGGTLDYCEGVLFDNRSFVGDRIAQNDAQSGNCEMITYQSRHQGS